MAARNPFRIRNVFVLVGFIWIAIFLIWNQDVVRTVKTSAITSITETSQAPVSSSGEVASASLPDAASNKPVVNNNLQNLQVSSSTIKSILAAPAPVTHNLELTISHHEMAPDGVIKKMTLINGLFPGPIIRARKGDRLRIRVTNDLDNFDESTSLHFHGLHQRGTNVMDGVPGVTQCGIPPESSEFVYEFDLAQSGSFWYHSHSRLQRVDGAFGGLVVYDNDESYQIERDYDEEIYIVLHDHYHAEGKELFDWYLGEQSSGFEPVPDSGLVNGAGHVDCDRVRRKHSCDSPPRKRPMFQFERGKRYRLRILNASAFAEITMSIDDHEMDIIEVDSTEVERYSVHMLTIAPGQRYSTIVLADSVLEAVMMRLQIQTSCFQYRPPALDKDFDTVIKYVTPETSSVSRFVKKLLKRDQADVEIEGDSYDPAEVDSISWEDALPEAECIDIDETKLVPIKSASVPDFTVRYKISPKTLNLERVQQAPFGFINRTTFQPAIGAPNIQVAFGKANILDTVTVPTVTGRDNDPVWGGAQLVTQIPHGAVVEMVINNSDDNAHPFHLHGHDFWVLRSYGERVAGEGRWREEYAEKYNTENPILRDTVTIPRRGHVVIRFVADNPGIWAFHCHIAWHLAAGMLMQFATGLDKFNPDSISDIMLDHCAMERDLGERLLRPLPGDEYRQRKQNKQGNPQDPED
ncbi:hypothetical protein BZA70DRAFT_297467 [Myxozyma melibiosi]|uniref:Multicopper oxidase n=1 Tax=Myxozyma melibiosi TaxID=54550 RepID=A0ABR1EZB4_9ASCO